MGLLRYTIEKLSDTAASVDAEVSAQVLLEWIRCLRAQAREYSQEDESPRIVLATASTNSPLIAEFECDESVVQADSDIGVAIETGHFLDLAKQAQDSLSILRKTLSKRGCGLRMPGKGGLASSVVLTGIDGVEARPIVKDATTLFGKVISLSYTDPHVRIRLDHAANTLRLKLSKEDAQWLARHQPESIMVTGVAHVIVGEQRVVRFDVDKGGLNRDFDEAKGAEEFLNELREAFEPFVASGALDRAVTQSMALRKGRG